jgi:2-phosphosulfolactate phosphatase
MRIQVALVPDLLPDTPAARGVCIVIDILRATTTLTTLLEYGAARVLVAPQVNEARALRAADPAALLLGEIGGLRPHDFDYGNSPHELMPTRVIGRRAICHTTNGTAAIRAAIAAPLTLLGCLRNATAVVEHAHAVAREQGVPLTIVCSGGGGGRAFALDDTLVAGELVALAAALANAAGQYPELDEAAAAALTLHRAAFDATTRPDAARWALALAETNAGRHLTELRLGADIPFCAQVDATRIVPVAALEGDAVVLRLPGG